MTPLWTTDFGCMNEKRLSFLDGPPPTPTVDSGRPTDTWIIQLEVGYFDPIAGEGHWEFYRYPNLFETDDWDEFERYCLSQVPLPRTQVEQILTYLHNFQVLNIDLRTTEVYPVIPRPRGFDVPIVAAV